MALRQLQHGNFANAFNRERGPLDRSDLFERNPVERSDVAQLAKRVGGEAHDDA